VKIDIQICVSIVRALVNMGESGAGPFSFSVVDIGLPGCIKSLNSP
jgi:hypothetical protein